MFVLGKTNLDRLEIYYGEDGGPWPTDRPTEDAAGVIEWYLRQLRGGDRHIFAQSDDGLETQRAGVIALTDHIVGIQLEDGTPLETLDGQAFDEMDGWIIGKVVRRITERMEETQRALGESETPSDS